jgi:tetratricopeptide (TPR) repeat protein
MSFDAALVEALLDDDDATGDHEAWQRLAPFMDDEGGGRYRFRHALIRDAAYEGLPYRRRRELHARVGSALLASAGDVEHEHAELLSLHFFLAGDYERSWRYSTVAADRAKAAYANIEAARFLRRAIDAGRRVPHIRDDEIATVGEFLGEALNIAGDFKKAADAYAAARRLVPEDRVAVARLLLKQSKIEESLGRYPQALRWATRGRRALDALDDAKAATMRAQLSAWYATVLYAEGRGSACGRWARLAIEEAQAADDRGALARAYNALEQSHLLLGLPTGEYWQRALTIYEELGDLVGQVLILTNLGVGAFYGGRWDDALAFYGRGRELSDRIGDIVGVAVLADNAAEILIEQGRLDEAEAGLRDSLKFWKASEYRYFKGQCLRFLGVVLARTERFDEAMPLFEESRSELEHLGAIADLLLTEARMAESFVVRGRSEEALGIVTQALSRTDAGEGANMATPLLERIRGYALTQMGDREAAHDAFTNGLNAARARSDDYETALALQALGWLDRIEGRPIPADREEEATSILHRLGVDRVAVIPGVREIART